MVAAKSTSLVILWQAFAFADTAAATLGQGNTGIDMNLIERRCLRPRLQGPGHDRLIGRKQLGSQWKKSCFSRDRVVATSVKALRVTRRSSTCELSFCTAGACIKRRAFGTFAMQVAPRRGVANADGSPWQMPEGNRAAPGIWVKRSWHHLPELCHIHISRNPTSLPGTDECF